MYHWKKFIRMIGYQELARITKVSKNISYLCRARCCNVRISHRLNQRSATQDRVVRRPYPADPTERV